MLYSGLFGSFLTDLVSNLYSNDSAKALRVLLHAGNHIRFHTTDILIDREGPRGITTILKTDPTFDWTAYVITRCERTPSSLDHVLTLLHMASVDVDYARVFGIYFKELTCTCNNPIYRSDVCKNNFGRRSHAIFKVSSVNTCREMLEICRCDSRVFRGCERLLRRRLTYERKIASAMASLPDTAIAAILGHFSF